MIKSFIIKYASKIKKNNRTKSACRFLNEVPIVTYDMIGKLGKVIKDVPIYGPVDSRRLGKSLGINLVDGGFVCNFECIYCEYKQEDINNKKTNKIRFRNAKEVLNALDEWFKENKKIKIDSITFAGNTDPLLNKQFEKILNGVVALRDKYRPKTPISLFTNSWNSGNIDLNEVDNAFLKLDVGSQRAFNKLCRPKGIKFNQIVKQIIKSNATSKNIQTILVGGKDGNFNNKDIDDYIKILLKISPDKIGLYSILYATPKKFDIKPVSDANLIRVAKKINSAFSKKNKNIIVEVFKNGKILGKPRIF